MNWFHCHCLKNTTHSWLRDRQSEISGLVCGKKVETPGLPQKCKGCSAEQGSYNTTVPLWSCAKATSSLNWWMWFCVHDTVKAPSVFSSSVQCARRTSKCFGWNEMERKQKERRPKEKKGIVILFELFVFFLSISFRVHFSLFQPSVKPNLPMK